MTSGEPTRGPLSSFELGLILALAALPRLAGLGHVSLWLDEILSSLRVGRDLAEAWQAWKGNPVHPPLSELSQWLWFRAVEPEPLRRMLPVALGVLTVGLLARLACRWFGRRAAWATALLAALSPLHLRYSQELRGYSLGLLALVLALAAGDLALQRRGWSGWAILALTLSLCYWSMYLSAVVLVPIALTMLQATAGRSTWRREVTGFALALVLSVALFSPWLSVVERAATKIHEQQATEWTWPLAGSRWQFLTVGGVEGERLSAGGLLFAAMVAAGIAAAAGSSRGRSVIAGALAGSVGVEVVLWLTDHWSNGRYNLASWPFLVMLAGLGYARIHGLVQRLVPPSDGACRSGVRRIGELLRWRTLGASVAALPLLATLAFQAVGLADYFRRGRPDWHGVARVTSAMASPDRPIWVGDERIRISLGYYLAQLEGSSRADVSSRVEVMDPGLEVAELAGRGCAVVVDSWRPRSEAIGELLLETPARRDFPRSRARVAAVGGRSMDPWSCLPEAVDGIPGERPRPRFLGVSDRRSNRRRFELTAEDQSRLRHGWSYPEQTPGGVTFRWALGRWAAMELPAMPATALRLEAWSLFEDQVMSVHRGRQLLATYPLATKKQTIEVPLAVAFDAEGGRPGNFGTGGAEIMVFGFTRYAGPQENPRPLAVAFDRVELLP